MLLLRLLSPGRLVLLVALIVAGYFLVSAGDSFVASSRLAADEERLRREIGELSAQEERLQQIRDYLLSDQYVEYIARRVFGLVKPGETLVIVQGSEPEGPEDRPPARTWWEELFGGG